MTWAYRTAESRKARDARIMEWWALGLSPREIAAEVDLTPQRVSQIVNSFGAGWRPARRKDYGLTKGGDAQSTPEPSTSPLIAGSSANGGAE